MHDEDDLAGLPAEPEQAGEDRGDGSVWSRLRQEHSRITRDRPPLELDVPGLPLVVRYRYVPLRDASKNAEKLARLKSIGEQALLASIDTLLMACDEILVRETPDSEPRPLADDGNPPIRFDERLARGMGWEPGPTGWSARSICRKLFANDYALVQQAREVSDWMSETSQDAAEDFLGG